MLLSSLLAVGLLVLSPADQPLALEEALEADGPRALQALAPAGLGASERRLVDGALAAFAGQDGVAEAELAAAMEDSALTPDLRRHAASFLAGVRLRAEDFDGAAQAFDVADQITPLVPDVAQARAFVEPLRGQPGIVMEGFVPGCLDIARDPAGLPRGDIAINGGVQEAVLDTGAAFSTITQSVAERMGLRPISGEVSVGAAGADDVSSSFAIADNLEIGPVRFSNVVFIVLPDEALSFAGGRYTIEAILGMPVFLRLERLSFAQANGTESFCFQRSEDEAGGSNIYLEGLSAIVEADVENAGAPLHLLIDTGAQATTLSARPISLFPALAQGAQARGARVGGAGGVVWDGGAVTLPELTVEIGGEAVTITGISAGISQGAAGRRDGLLGQDVLSARGGFTLDFKTMRLELLDG
ncbi:MAG: retroviral-like aspartic protease family protein [Oceanicaulis sp.]|uniref:pepsin/retropepsin-like aspartic protease family protein n=1 Tax=Glycocaulis sp. TaxID=1969725 RepID=UPI0025C6AD79|nr:pepsin/retropepsin-like aspartic protease family protein [Glycocaulis sp.]MCC5980843.1 retroviral-like aspartic protease family protein [Oceanicaulis sp.]MCH8520570.1 retroviral-like aspartic protease family protein [Glycocaulis sp.]